MNIEFTNNPKSRTISALFIPVGTVFSATIGGKSGPFLKTYSHIVDLTDANRTWGLYAEQEIDHYVPYPPDKVKLVIDNS